LPPPAAPPLPPLPTRIRWVESLCAQLAAYHDRGVAHGGLHDGRVLFQPDGDIRLDFSPRDTLRLGNSPEQLAGQPFDARSDVFAAGCIAYRILTGRFPFAGATLSAVTYAMMYEDPPDPRPVAPVSARVVEWLRRSLAKEPADRFRDGAEMRDALRAADISKVPRTARVVEWLRRSLAKEPAERFRDGAEMRDALRAANVSEVPRTASILLVSVPRKAVGPDGVDREIYVINLSTDVIEVRTSAGFLTTVDEDTGQGVEHGPRPTARDVRPGAAEKVGDVLGWELDSALYFQVSFRARGEAAWTHLGFDLKRPDDDEILPVLGVRGSRYGGRVVAENGASE
jgi:hypothetical protein